jgi:F0F1-type ATP synthase assembly protein I
MKNRNQKNKNKFDAFIRFSSLAFEMMAMIAAGTFMGYKIDQWMDNEFKGFTLGLMILSVIGSVIYSTRKILKK